MKGLNIAMRCPQTGEAKLAGGGTLPVQCFLEAGHAGEHDYLSWSVTEDPPVKSGELCPVRFAGINGSCHLQRGHVEPHEWKLETQAIEVKTPDSNEANTIKFCPNNGDPMLIIDEQGIEYKGKRIEDAGEAHAACLAVFRTMIPTTPAENACLRDLIKAFVEKQEIRCPESIYQMDNVIENAYELLEQLITIVGYYKEPDHEPR